MVKAQNINFLQEGKDANEPIYHNGNIEKTNKEVNEQ